MNSERMSMVIDTNVWIDMFDGDRPHSPSSIKSLQGLSRCGVDLLFAVTSVKDVHYMLMNKLKHVIREDTGTLEPPALAAASSYANACIEMMNSQATAIGVDMSDVWLAEKYCKQFSDFGDCLVIAAARRAHADCIVTNDERFLRQRLFAAMRPEEALCLAKG